jgi:hypothetical protein
MRAYIGQRCGFETVVPSLHSGRPTNRSTGERHLRGKGVDLRICKSGSMVEIVLMT